jgi:DNA modification methylase
VRVEHIGDATLYLGDCLEILPTLSGVDAVVTDPPYGIEKAEWDAAYPDWLVPVSFTLAHTVCVMPGLWALQRCVNQMGERYKSVVAGWNANGMTHGPIGFNNWIPAVVGGDVPRKGQDACRFTVGSEDKPDHPSPKPPQFMQWLVERVTEPEWVVCDPFMGSGTTGVACANLGRPFIGIEIEPKYFDIACKRIEDAYKQPRLFDEPRPEPVQAQMFGGDDD